MEHPTNKAIDLVALKIGNLINDSDMVEFWRSERFLPTDVAVDLGTETLVVGYPLGFYDTHHNLPIVRSGTVATTFGAMFRGQPLFLIDAVLHPGTSGSPVVLPRSTVQKMISGDIRMGNFPPYLLGINSGEYRLDGIGLGLNTIWYAGLVLDILNQ
jgi:S1-C subfamily serine protease